MENLNLSINQENGKTFVTLDGRIDTSNADQFLEAVNPLMQAEGLDIDIDCTNLTYTSSQGLRIFLMMQKSAMAHKGKLVMRNMNPQVKEVFDITGFSNIITIV